MASPRFFRSAAEFRRWLSRHHASATELWVGFRKTAAARAAFGYSHALDEALCFGWIDGVRRSIDDERYMQRFTPRTPRSRWSRINIARVEKLTAAGRMHEAGQAVFAKRSAKGPTYSNESDIREFDAASLKRFRANARAWSWFSGRAPSYRRVASFWVLSAKKPETRARRLDTLIACSAKHTTIPLLTRKPKATTRPRT
ncbi:MAG TPA: YdeI/OmpD-associated family protein [Nannocystaceae bacterium]|nr:YdeI/OmpD-associated family protein [Nannocystaceae bacterium]